MGRTEARPRRYPRWIGQICRSGGAGRVVVPAQATCCRAGVQFVLPHTSTGQRDRVRPALLFPHASAMWASEQSTRATAPILALHPAMIRQPSSREMLVPPSLVTPPSLLSALFATRRPGAVRRLAVSAVCISSLWALAACTTEPPAQGKGASGGTARGAREETVRPATEPARDAAGQAAGARPDAVVPGNNPAGGALIIDPALSDKK